jgi:hypothetical protein
MKSRFAAVSIGLLGCAGLLLASCSKSDTPETTASETEVAPVDPAPKPAGDDLEAAIKAPGPKTVTAVGAGGKTKVIPMGGTTLAETDTYVVNANVPASATTGADTVVTINLTPKTGWKINQEFPTKLKVTAPEGVSLASDTQSASDADKFSEKAAVFQVKFKAESAGDKKFTADFRFAVCTDATCDPKKAALAWNLPVK